MAIRLGGKGSSAELRNAEFRWADYEASRGNIVEKASGFKARASPTLHFRGEQLRARTVERLLVSGRLTGSRRQFLPQNRHCQSGDLLPPGNANPLTRLTIVNVYRVRCHAKLGTNFGVGTASDASEHNSRLTRCPRSFGDKTCKPLLL